MNVLLLGSGGREHAFAWKLSQSKLLTQLFIAPGNAGTSQCGTNVNMSANDFGAIEKFVLENKIQMVVVGPEDPLVAGIFDYFQNNESLKKIPVIGPSKSGAQLEGSKDFSKQFMMRHKIPTARYQSFTKENLEEGFKFLDSLKEPYVLKADGLAAGKGVLILNDVEEAKRELHAMIEENKFGKASATVVIEEFLKGIECSVFVLTDGVSYKILPAAKDYKRIGDGDTGLNTGGMGAVSPVPFCDDAFINKVEQQIIIPTIEGLKKENITYQGFIFIGLMNENGEPNVVEYNVRMGDPETEAVLPRIKNDLLELFIATANQKLNTIILEIDERTAVTVMLVSGGYPRDYEKGKLITGLEEVEGNLVFHAGTLSGSSSGSSSFQTAVGNNQNKEASNVITNGGRVIAVTSFGNSIAEARDKSYENIARIKFDRMNYRKDIGMDLM
ncbi:MAG: phosphoribosylamine--glycine ligase [Bacteroidia bacterium]